MRKFTDISGLMFRTRVKDSRGRVKFTFPSTPATPLVRTRWGRFLRG
jgi:hypothetical protein